MWMWSWSQCTMTFLVTRTASITNCIVESLPYEYEFPAHKNTNRDSSFYIYTNNTHSLSGLIDITYF